MRTTIDVDDAALQAAKEIAALKGITLGKAISELLRRGAPLTMKRVNELRDEW